MQSLSIVIKALNEEAKIDAALRSALAAAAELSPRPVEIVLADSASTDATVARAARYPEVRVVRLRDPAERGCGAGVELGFRAARGELLFFMDGDMQLQPGFLPRAIEALEQDPQLAGVGGVLVDAQVRNAIDAIRQANPLMVAAGRQPWLGGGGLYRRRAIEAAGGYAGHRGLQGYEEAELGLRLGRSGWFLQRLAQAAVTHDGHVHSGLALLHRHWRSGRAQSVGQMLRLGWQQGWWPRFLWAQRHALVMGSAAGLAVLVGLLVSPWALAGWAAVQAVLLALLRWRKRSWEGAFLSWYAWHHAAAALVAGLRRPLPPAGGGLAHDCVQAGAWLNPR